MASCKKTYFDCSADTRWLKVIEMTKNSVNIWEDLIVLPLEMGMRRLVSDLWILIEDHRDNWWKLADDDAFFCMTLELLPLQLNVLTFLSQRPLEKLGSKIFLSYKIHEFEIAKFYEDTWLKNTHTKWFTNGLNHSKNEWELRQWIMASPIVFLGQRKGKYVLHPTYYVFTVSIW